MNVKALILMACLALAAGESAVAGEVRSLAGRWRFALDREDAGVAGAWFGRELGDSLRLPGSLQEQGFGDLPSLETKWMGDLNDRTFFQSERYAPYRKLETFKFPYWLTPTRYYAGVAWYQRDVEIPTAWSGLRMVLHLERPHWETTVWLDGRRIGSNNSLAVPHRYELGTEVAAGRHRLTIRVDNRYVVPVGVNSHSVSDHTQGNWNGLAGDLHLEALEPVRIEDLQVYPEVGPRVVTVRGRIDNRTGSDGSGTVRLEARGAGGARAGGPVSITLPVRWGREGGEFEGRLELGADAPLWDEFQPARFRLEAGLTVSESGPGGRAGRREAVTTTYFGLREVKVVGTQIVLNGRPVFLRGTLECCIFPRTGYPPTDVAAWRRILRVARAHGLNHLRFHSWTPPRAAFEAADELGFYLYVECPTWANGDTSVGDGRPVDAWVYAEGDRILREHGNHPSFILLSYGNEPGGKNQNRWLGDLVRHWQATDRRRLYTSGAGWPMIPENDVHVTPNARAFPVHAKLGETAGDYSAFQGRQDRPLISHEIGQYCVFPNLDEIPRYRGWLQARNFEIVRDFLRQGGMLGQARDFLRASGRLQTLFYKDEIEACLRTSGWAGFELLDLHDFPGQGTALVGVLDPFWGEKGYVAPAEFRRFCDDTVPLARLPKRVWTAAEPFVATVDAAHFGAADLELVEGAATWRIREGKDRTIARGSFAGRRLPTGRLSALGEVRLEAGTITAPTALNLEVALRGSGGRSFVNDWNFWVYPAVDDVVPAGVTVAGMWNDDVRRALEGGGRVVLFADPRWVNGRTVGRFDPIFWNRNWFPSQPQHTLGLLVDPRHPALAGFPTAFHADWQWQDIQNRSKPMILDGLPAGLKPAVQVIDDWNTCRKLGLVFEARVGTGRLLVCAADLSRDLAERPVARQLRRSLLDYAAGPAFRPGTRLEAAQVAGLFREPSLAERVGARVVRVDSEQAGFEGTRVLDGDPQTFWHTAWGDAAPSYPHELVIGFEQEATLSGIALLPRQDGNRNGWIREYEVAVSGDRESWGEPVARGALGADANEKEIRFGRTVSGRYLRLTVRSGFDAQPFASLAELRLNP